MRGNGNEKEKILERSSSCFYDLIWKNAVNRFFIGTWRNGIDGFEGDGTQYAKYCSRICIKNKNG